MSFNPGLSKISKTVGLLKKFPQKNVNQSFTAYII